MPQLSRSFGWRDALGVLSVLALAAFFSTLLADAVRNPLRALAAYSGREFHVSGQNLPTSIGSPTAVEGGALDAATIGATSGIVIDMLIIANTSSSSQTVHIEDCGSTAFLFFNDYPIAAKTTWTIPIPNTRFTGCFKWSASATTVQGTVTGKR